MLNNEEIKKAINKNEIEILISFGMKDNVPILYDFEHNLLDDSLKSNLYSDRLKLTMGPIVKILNKKTVSKKYRFKASNKLYDLRKTNHKYVISPGESIIILTNERMKLNGKYACLIVPRISLSDVGIVVTTAYVDPFYDGLMRLHLSNLSDKPYELHTLEAVAQCFFFEFSESVSEMFKDQFPTKSVFFGQTWKGILNSDRNPFPTKKEPIIVEKFTTLKYQLSIIWDFIKKYSIIFLLLTNFIVIISGFVTFKQSYEEYTFAIEQLRESFNPINSEIIIDSGEVYGEKSITIDCSKSNIISILCNNDNIKYRIVSGDTQDTTRIIFSYSLLAPSDDKYEINFTYSVIRRIEK